MLITSHFIHKKNGGIQALKRGGEKSQCDVGKSMGDFAGAFELINKKNPATSTGCPIEIESLILGEKKIDENPKPPQKKKRHKQKTTTSALQNHSL